MANKRAAEWKILKLGKKRDFAIIIGITVIFLLVIAMNVRLIFQMTSNQTEEIGQMQLESIRGDLQETIAKAEGVTTRMALLSEQLINSGTSLEDLEKFYIQKKAEQMDATNGVCFNVYIACKDWAIIPDFDMPDDYHATERLWYKGALENPDQIYITNPYIDAASGVMCFTISKVLPDNNTVVALDFNFSDVQQSVLKMRSTGDHTALISTKGGMIIGYTDMSLVGEKIFKRLPEYEPILSRVVQSNRNESFVANIDGRPHTIFSAETKNGWYMILSVDNGAFYRDSYNQIIFTTLLSLIMIVVIIVFYLNSMKNGLQAEQALRVKEEFLSRLSKDLKDPLKNILQLSNIKSQENISENAAQVRESALQLSDMLDNLLSFSTIVESDKRKLEREKKFSQQSMATFSRNARLGIVAVLILAMLISLFICISTTFSWGDTKMNREVDVYEHQLSDWIGRHRSILGMFVNLVSERPEIMDDYPSAVKFLNDIAQNYPEISACYIGNPYKEHQLIMNDGWESEDKNWRVDQRPWYVDTWKTEDGFSVSAPYYDDKTGLYCITLSQIVYGQNDKFLGVFGIDFYLDRLTQVLGESYTKDGYAFLVDRNGIIINHPNNNYQMSVKRMTDILKTEYAKAYDVNQVVTLKDYSGNYVACLSKKNTTSDFTVIVASSWWNIYGNILVLTGVFLILLIICTAIVSTLINRQIRWQDIVNRELKEASDTAMAASQAKSQFLAQMSHEIRTPINAVLGMNEMILRESKDEEILDYASNISSAGRTLLTLINSILDFSKIEDGKMEICPVRYETVILIDDLVNMISEKAKKKGLEFKTEIDSALPKSLYGDDVRIRQIITNLLTNAVKYTPEGSVTLSIDGKEIDDDSFELNVKVIDTGIGIRKEDMNKLFKSFQRLDVEKNRNIEGTGLGIVIVQKLLAMMGSRLEVESEYGKGSNFSFKLIQKIIDKTPVGNYSEHQAKRLDENVEKKFLKAGGAKVLAVDDNNMNLKVITGLLKRNEIVPDLADSGQRCIEMAKENFYHIIFLDNMMPGMNGVETLKEMKRENILSEKTAVVMLTASAISGMKEIYLREGFDDYLSKPIEIDELEKILANHLPKELISFEIEHSNLNQQSTEPEEKISEDKDVEEIPAEEVTEEDTFTQKEREIFNATCPDVDLDTGLGYCMDSKSFLIEMLSEFVEGDKTEKIQNFFDAQDFKNYQIIVHALKGTAFLIGAMDLGEKAKSLELAAKENNVEEILNNHESLLADYEKVRSQIAKWLEENS